MPLVIQHGKDLDISTIIFSLIFVHIYYYFYLMSIEYAIAVISQHSLLKIYIL